MALLASAALAGLLVWHHRRRARAARDRQAVLSYLDGPLSDYMMAASRGLTALLSRPGTGRAKGLAGASAYYARSVTDLEALLKGMRPDAWREHLASTLPLLKDMAARARAWPAAGPRDLPALIQGESRNRMELWAALEALKPRAFRELGFSFNDQLEWNAYLYSLKGQLEYARQAVAKARQKP